jgi:hypothetical protein
MRFNLDDLNPAAWFDVPDDSDNGRVQIRTCAGSDLEAIAKESTRKRVEYKKSQRFEFVDTDEDKYQRLLWDHCLVDWKNIFDGAGKKIPCTTDNKLLLMKNSISFANLIGDCLETINEDSRIFTEVAEKNSKSSQPVS